MSMLFVEVLEEVRLWVVLESKTRCAGGFRVQWEGKRGVEGDLVIVISASHSILLFSFFWAHGRFAFPLLL